MQSVATLEAPPLRLMEDVRLHDMNGWRTGYNWSLDRTAAELGKSVNSILRYERTGNVPKTVRLAMAAIDLRYMCADLKRAIRDDDDRQTVRLATKLVRRAA